ncbi:NADP-dependent oxidoreductase [Chitinophaga nivalis]|uniref:NADP-dependent oxidoreductase n=1 Tax=Chitinophaga nivalis TaxID=2991709 RepID=A0ABT3IKV3_9BACT|nr:NADP-dependent oxidoreductase [Chitinophaga nivalis]MCW3465717.1 NADP-dependent oxidoreductase [Chitinophaga nivalis]MCW3484592.1 NADP-dependent oxidoreductase [Chitinophaga nivalis]
MKAVAVAAFKEHPVVMDLPKPAVRPGTVLVKVIAAGINPFDWKMTDGIMNDGKIPHQFPLIMGVDGAGIVEEVGAGVTRFKTGDQIYGQFIHMPIGEGSYAEYAIVPETASVTQTPASISAIAAAAVPTAGMTAQQLLETLALPAGATLLVNGATGGVGSFVTQLAAAQQLQVIATVGDEAAAARMKGLGAAYTINYQQAPLLQQVQDLFPQGIDGLIDLVSDAAGFNSYVALVKPGGAAATTVFVADEAVLAAKNIRGGNFETKGSAASLEQLSQAIDKGSLKVPVENEIRLEEAPEAIAHSREGKGRGKTVIVIN